MSYLHVTFKCHPTSARPRNFRRIPQNCTEIFSAEFCGIPEKNWNDISVHFHWISAHFNRTVDILWKCTEIRGESISVRKCAELYGNRWKKLCTSGNVRKSDLVEIWVELAFQLDLNCSENAKKNYCKKLLVEIKYKTKDNLTPN